MNHRRILAVMYRHACDAGRNLNRVTDTFYWPIQNILVWGFFTLYLARQHGLEPGTVTYLLGGITLWTMFYGFQRDLANGFMEEMWTRNLLNLFSTPLTISEYMTGLVILSLLKALAGLALSAVLAGLCYAVNLVAPMPMLVPYLLVLMIFSLALGLVVTGLVIRFSTKFQTLAWSLAGVLMPVSCVFYPLETLPGWLQPIAWALPTTQSFEGMREVISRGAFSLSHFAWGLGLAVLYFALATGFFSWMFSVSRTRGFLVRPE